MEEPLDMAESHLPYRIALVANTDWYLYNFRSGLANHLKSLGFEVHVICPDGPFRLRLESLGFTWHQLDLNRGAANPLSEWRAYRRLRKIYLTIRPDLVHHFTLQCVVWGTFAAQSAGVGAIVNALAGMGSLFHGETFFAHLLRRPVTSLLRRALRSPNTQTIFQNPDDLNACVHYFSLSPESVHLIRGSGVDVTKFSPVERSLLNPNILFVGRLLRDKGILDFISAASSLRNTHPNWSFQIAGTPDPGNPSSLSANDVETLAAKNPNVSFLGHKEDMVALLASAHLVVLPSRYGEGVPRSLIEAAASGLPLIATDHPGCREIVNHGENGYLVPKGDTQILASRIEDALLDEPKWRSFSRCSRLLAEREFSSVSVFQATIQVYSRLVPNANWHLNSELL